ncbi:MAG: hypothetical protein QG608_904 [Actinomycetota bacterium]|nr:hypothetical protein [Actinomycetota bacterium]
MVLRYRVLASPGALILTLVGGMVIAPAAMADGPNDTQRTDSGAISTAGDDGELGGLDPAEIALWESGVPLTVTIDPVTGALTSVKKTEASASTQLAST